MLRRGACRRRQFNQSQAEEILGMRSSRSAATLPTPDMWNVVGSTTLASVPAGNLLTVANEIVWAQADIPATGHYCFVAIVSTPNDPAPPLTDLVNFDNYLAFIRNYKNATWRNFNVVPSIGPAADPSVAMPFLVVGALDRALAIGLDHPASTGGSEAPARSTRLLLRSKRPSGVRQADRGRTRASCTPP